MSAPSPKHRPEMLMPGGVNSPVRSFNAVDQEPFIASRAAGCRVWDNEDRSYIDYIGSWGPMILGHAHHKPVEAIKRAAASGTSFGLSTEIESEFAELLIRLVPSLELIRLVSSGTEACMSAIRLARGFTSRDRLLKVAGGYHGHADPLLVRAGSGAETCSVPDSAGVPASVAGDTLLTAFNDLDEMKDVFASNCNSIAAVIIEPIAGNMGCIPPHPGYLDGVSKLCNQHGSLLIFDEIMTGFRVGIGGAQQLYGVRPDLTCLGKIAGGGLPLACYGGRREVMEHVSPLGSVYQAGTLSGNPLAVAAGLATISELERTNPYPELERISQRLQEGLHDGAERAGLAISVNRVGSMMTLFFGGHPVDNLKSARACDLKAFSRFHQHMRRRGILFPPSQFEAFFVSASHDEEAVDETIEAAREFFDIETRSRQNDFNCR